MKLKDISYTTKGYFKLLRPDGTQLSQHSAVKEAYERAQVDALANGVNAVYTIVPANEQVAFKFEAEVCVVTPPVDPPVDPEPPVDPPVDPNPPVEPPTGTLAIDYSYVDKTGAAFTSFIALIESQISGVSNYGFSIQDAAVAFKLTGNDVYRQLARRMAEAQVAAAESAIAAGNKPEVAGDSYLQIGPMISGLAMAYAWCDPTDAQRARWKAYADQAIHNVWNFDSAKWGNTPFPGNGWGANNPGNNYFYSFCNATIHWALATNNDAQLEYMRTNRLPMLDAYVVASLEGGGSREGTGYGLSAKVVFEFLAAWRDSGRAIPTNLANHARNSVLWWVNATMPNRACLSPIGDLPSGDGSYPNLMEYHRELMMRAAWISDDATRKLAGYWAANATWTPNYNRTWARRNALFTAAPGGGNPGAKAYHAKGTGNLWGRTGWDAQAKAVHIIAGPFDESHACEEQGGFTYFCGGGLQAVSSNVFARSGINQAVSAHNVLRFTKAGQVIHQRRVDPSSAGCKLQGVLLNADGSFVANANIKPVYPDAAVVAYTRSYAFAAGVLEVTDDFTVAAGTTATFQVCTPTRPVIAGNTATTAKLKITVLEPAGAVLTFSADPNGENGEASREQNYRLDVNNGSTRYKVRLEALN